jgi:uncharacterized protein YjbI with pentapeptide repeats
MTASNWTSYRIGFPYARPSKDFNHAVIECCPTNISGFNEVSYKDRRYRLNSDDKGKNLLNAVDGKGCHGILYQIGDKREIIDYKKNIICGQGSSSQLALSLAVYSRYISEDDRKSAPLILLSAAIEYPLGAPPFFEARIKTYCDASNATSSLLDKYQAALEANASYLILPIRDLQILQSELVKSQKDCEIVPLSNLKNNTPTTNLNLIGVEEDELPILAEHIGISRYHYQKEIKEVQSKSVFSNWVMIGSLILINAFIIFYLFFFHTPDRVNDDLKNTQSLISTIYGSETQGTHPRIRDEALKEYVMREKSKRKYNVRRVKIDRIDLTKVNLSKADLHSLDLSNINFLNADISNGNLNDVNFENAYLKNVDFSNTYLYKAKFNNSFIQKANFHKAVLRSANLFNAIGLENANLKGCYFDDETVWPTGMNKDKAIQMGAIYAPISNKPVFE